MNDFCSGPTDSVWSPRQLDSLSTFLDLWRPLLPVWILANVLEQIVLPKLQVATKLKSFGSLILSTFEFQADVEPSD